VEAPVYDRVARWGTSAGALLFFVPLLAFLIGLRAIDRKAAADLLVVLEVLSAVYTGLFLFLHVMTNVWIRIDTVTTKVFHVYKLFVWPIYQRMYDLSQFDRVSLHRSPRGGYRATLVGRDREVVVAASWNLARARNAAERTSAVSRLRLNDQI
jgi:hypothetical protein